ncbi:glycerophosphodiester phosphodiesterase family protein [uncultured Bacteroides sp.]|uniref:glycerophosphodiester phosphodiesterase family protein n=1 Tax=uncultured Bacteroides sp. TaxID=162156 RepID=UPI002AA70989|nr:glycerophosphodiester phosphodiesterase family protein [uncultured Bacteroides sp.]
MEKILIRPLGLFLICGALLAGCKSAGESNIPLVHAHRGGAALYPENTIPAMLNAVKIGVPFLELDMHISRDSQVIVSHDAFFNSIKALTPEGDTIPKADMKNYKYYTMTYDSIRKYDVGSLPNPAFPLRKNLKCRVPLVAALIDSVEAYTAATGKTPVSYNIEIKSDPAKDGVFSPDYKTFADLCMRVLLSKNLGNRLLVQCFDVRTLNYVHKKYPSVRLSYLVEDEGVSFDALMAKLNFTPQVYSPEHDMLTKEVVLKAHAIGMQVAPWTVDKREEILRLKRLGVDAIITNQPDSVMMWLGSKESELK